MATLWEKFLDRNKAKAEVAAAPEKKVEIFNPFGLGNGDIITIDDETEKMFRFTVSCISVLETTIGNETFKYADYTIVDPSQKSDESPDGRLRVLRVCDVTSSYTCAEPQLAMVLLSPDISSEYQEAIEDDLKKGIFPITDPTFTDFARPGGITMAFPALIKSYEQGGKETTNSIEYWDFSGAISGMPAYYFIEKNCTTGWFQGWIGTTLDPNKVHALHLN